MVAPYCATFSDRLRVLSIPRAAAKRRVLAPIMEGRDLTLDAGRLIQAVCTDGRCGPAVREVRSRLDAASHERWGIVEVHSIGKNDGEAGFVVPGLDG